MARWLVTGGAGFIGSNIARTLVEKGESVRILDNFFSGKEENIAPFRKKIELIRGDIRDARTVARAVKNVDYVLHQAALRSVGRSIDDPISTNDVNVNGTVQLLWSSLSAGVKRVVYASSSSVYGDRKEFPQKPEQAPQPISPYAVSKLAAENYCRVFAKTMGLSTVSLRYFNVFGPGQDFKSKYAVVIPIFINAALKDEPIPVHGDGRQSRDFAYIDNVVSANLLAAKRAGVSGEVFNVACGETHSLLDYIRILEKITGRRLQKKFGKNRPGDVARTWADISKTRRLLGYRPMVRFEEGVKKTYEFFQSRRVYRS